VENCTRAEEPRLDYRAINPAQSRQALAGIVAVPAWMVTHPQIDHTAFRVYCYLVARFNRRTHLAWPSARTIGEGLDLSIRSVRRCIKILRELGLIDIRSRKRGNGGQKSNGYVPLFSAWDELGWEPTEERQRHPENLQSDDHRAVIGDTGVTPHSAAGVTPPGVPSVSPHEPIVSIVNEPNLTPQPPALRGAMPAKTTRKEKELIHKLSPVVDNPCAKCGELFTETDLAKRDVWGILKPAVVSVKVWPEQQHPTEWPDPTELSSVGDAIYEAAKGSIEPYEKRNYIDAIFAEAPDPKTGTVALWFDSEHMAAFISDSYGEAISAAFPDGWNAAYPHPLVRPEDYPAHKRCVTAEDEVSSFLVARPRKPKKGGFI
jgi:hypothetical protein